MNVCVCASEVYICVGFRFWPKLIRGHAKTKMSLMPRFSIYFYLSSNRQIYWIGPMLGGALAGFTYEYVRSTKIKTFTTTNSGSIGVNGSSYTNNAAVSLRTATTTMSNTNEQHVMSMACIGIPRTTTTNFTMLDDSVNFNNSESEMTQATTADRY